jgi:hypothetical protein
VLLCYRKHELSGLPLTPVGCCGQASCTNPSSVRFLLEDLGLNLDFLCCPPPGLPAAKVRS